MVNLPDNDRDDKEAVLIHTREKPSGFFDKGFIPSMNSIWYKVMSPLPEKTVEQNEPAA